MNYYCSHIKDKEKKIWEKLVSQNPYSGFHQTFAWADFRRLHGWDTYKIGLYEKNTDKLVGGAIIYEFTFSNGTSFLYIPEGPILNHKNEKVFFAQWRVFETALHSIVSLSQNLITTHIRIEPRIQNLPSWFLLGWQKAPLNLQPKHTRILDLSLSEESLFQQFKPKGRYNIRVAIKKDVRVREANFSEIKTFYKLYKETAKRDLFESKKLKFFQYLLSNLKNNVKLFIAETDNKALAAALVIYFGKRATYLYGASGNKNRNYMAPYILHWEIIKNAKQNKYLEYDFWGIAESEDDVNHGWHGLTIFKSKFGGKQINFLGAYDYIYQENAYTNFINTHESN